MEKAYVLDKQNAGAVKQLFSLGSDQDPSMRLGAVSLQSEPKIITIRLNKEELKKHTAALKNIFDKYPGEYVLYMEINGNNIRTQTKIDASLDLKKELDEVVGEGRMKIH